MTTIAEDSIKRTIRIAPPRKLSFRLDEATYLNHFTKTIDEATYLNNFLETVYANIKRLNVLESLKITGFEDARHLRRFEGIFLGRMDKDKLISTGKYLREANETELTYTIRTDF